MNREEFILYLAKRLEDKYQSQVTWPEVAAAFGQASQVDKDAIATAFSTGDITSIGEKVRVVVSGYISAQAVTRANSIMQDNVMSTEELLEVFG